MNTNRDNLKDLIYAYCKKNGLDDPSIDKIIDPQEQYLIDWLETKVSDKQRSSRQNAALHLYFTKLANELNEAGYDMAHFPLSEGVSIPWDSRLIKEKMWRPIQRAKLDKKSTTTLTTKEIDIIYDIVNRAVAERTGVSVSFPSEEEARAFGAEKDL